MKQKRKLSLGVALSMAVTLSTSIGFSDKVAYASTGLTVTDVSTTNSIAAQELANKLAGSGVTISNAKFTGVTTAAGVFVGGSTSVGFDSGIILSTGSAQGVKGISSDLADTDNEQPGDTSANGSPNLEEIISGTQDAAILEFDVTSQNDKLTFEYAFASEEYDDLVNTAFNDAFALFVNGVNQAVLPNTSTVVSINNVNAGNPVGTNAKNSEYYIDNVDGHLPFSMNGITTVLSVSASITPNVPNHIKIAIADVGDHAYDSNIFIKANSLTVTDEASAVEDETTTAAVTIEGTKKVGETLTAQLKDAAGNNFTTSAAVTYEWYRLDNSDSEFVNQIGTGKNYILTGSDLSKYIGVRVTCGEYSFEYVIGRILAASSSSSHHHHSTTADTTTNTDTKKNDNKTGWTDDINDTKYYLKEDGSKTTGWKLIDNTWYFFNNRTGAMIRGWYKSEAGDWTFDKNDTVGQWFHLDQDGKLTLGWYKDTTDGNWYYLCNGDAYGALGVMITGWQKIDGKWYYFNNSGVMASNAVVDGYTLGSDGAWIE